MIVQCIFRHRKSYELDTHGRCIGPAVMWCGRTVAFEDDHEARIDAAVWRLEGTIKSPERLCPACLAALAKLFGDAAKASRPRPILDRYCTDCYHKRSDHRADRKCLTPCCECKRYVAPKRANGGRS